MKNPPILFAKTQKILGQIESKVGEPFITYWNSPNGSICDNDVSGLFGILRNKGKVGRLSLFIKSPGGSGQAPCKWCTCSANSSTSHRARSSRMRLGRHDVSPGRRQNPDGPSGAPFRGRHFIDARSSPIDRDNDRVRVSQDELHRVVRLWQKEASKEDSNPYQSLFAYVHPLVIGAVDRSSALSTKLCIEILSYHLRDRKKAQRISNILNSEYPSHGYPITLREARRIGLKAEALSEDVNQLLFELNEMYAEMGQPASTDFDERNSHNNSILNIIEGKGLQIFFQNDKDWHYRTEERRWVGLNDKSCWRKAETVRGRTAVSIFHVR